MQTLQLLQWGSNNVFCDYKPESELRYKVEAYCYNWFVQSSEKEVLTVRK
jgi:hypothetical protein